MTEARISTLEHTDHLQSQPTEWRAEIHTCIEIVCCILLNFFKALTYLFFFGLVFFYILFLKNNIFLSGALELCPFCQSSLFLRVCSLWRWQPLPSARPQCAPCRPALRFCFCQERGLSQVVVEHHTHDYTKKKKKLYKSYLVCKNNICYALCTVTLNVFWKCTIYSNHILVVADTSTFIMVSSRHLLCPSLFLEVSDERSPGKQVSHQCFRNLPVGHWSLCNLPSCSWCFLFVGANRHRVWTGARFGWLSSPGRCATATFVFHVRPSSVSWPVRQRKHIEIENI